MNIHTQNSLDQNSLTETIEKLADGLERLHIAINEAFISSMYTLWVKCDNRWYDEAISNESMDLLEWIPKQGAWKITNGKGTIVLWGKS